MDLREGTGAGGGTGLRDKLADLIDRPGVYRFLDGAGETIYVGKAKSLRNRVRSYFQRSAGHPPRIARMVSEVSDLDVIVVDTEVEALILESNLIKRERPRYNVVLRDDKNFPYLKLSVRDPFPRVSLVRRAKLDGQRYVGPFLPASAARRSMKMVQRYFQVATCREIFDGKRRPCLYYHLDQCLAPCAGKTGVEEYGRAVADAELFLDGRHTELEGSLQRRMEEASRERNYESAIRLRDTLRTVQGLAVRQRMASVGLEEQDFFAHHEQGGQVALQLFQMRAGTIQSRREFTMSDVELEVPAFYATVLMQYYAENPPPPEVYLPESPSDPKLLEAWLGQRREGRVRITVPRRGPKRKFLDLVRKNALLAFESRFRARHTHAVQGLEALGTVLGLDEAPFRIECFDVSNLQGTDSVVGMVVWEGGRPRKSEYRTYGLRGVEGPDDLASIGEAVTRRYRRLLAEDRRIPELVLIDGGRGQRGAAVAALTRVGLPMLTVVAIAKREEELYIDAGSTPLRLGREDPALQLVQRIRDEAHRFALSRHRRKRSGRTLRSELTEIPGVGPVTAGKLLREFGSVKRIREASPEALGRVAGPKTARAILARYRENG